MVEIYRMFVMCMCQWPQKLVLIVAQVVDLHDASLDELGVQFATGSSLTKQAFPVPEYSLLQSIFFSLNAMSKF